MTNQSDRIANRDRALSILFAFLAMVCATITYVCAAIVDFERWAVYGFPLSLLNYLVIRWIGRSRKPRNGRGYAMVSKLDVPAKLARLSGKLAAKGRR